MDNQTLTTVGLGIGSALVLLPVLAKSKWLRYGWALFWRSENQPLPELPRDSELQQLIAKLKVLEELTQLCADCPAEVAALMATAEWILTSKSNCRSGCFRNISLCSE